MRRLVRLSALGLVATFAALLILTLLTARPADPALWPPAAGEPATDVFVVSHGYHAGLALPLAEAARIASRDGMAALGTVARRFAGYPYVEIGWGDEGFYRAVPDLSALTLPLALRALLRPGNPSVLHVVGLQAPPRAVFPAADIVRVPLGEAGIARLLRALELSFAVADGAPQPLGPGLYGSSLFFRANEPFHIFNVCNHWLARLLAAAGLPAAPVLAILPAGLLLDLEWRGGLTAMPKGARGEGG
jgi:uncharacterized protein (TIGR02117 family)